VSPSERPPQDPGPESADRGGLSRRQFFGAAAAVGAAIVWASEFPFSDAVIGQTISPGAGPTGPTGVGPVVTAPATAGTAPSPSFTG